MQAGGMMLGDVMKLRLLLTHKIGSISVVAVLGLVAITALYLWGSATQARMQKLADRWGALAANTSPLSNQMLLARRAEKDFLLRRDARYIAAHADVVKRMAATMEQMNGRFAELNQDALAQKLASSRGSYDTYVKHFQGLVDAVKANGLNENDGLQGTLRKSVHEIETEANRLKDAKLEAGMLMMRRHEKDYMLRGDAKYGATHKSAAAAFSEVLAA